MTSTKFDRSNQSEARKPFWIKFQKKFFQIQNEIGVVESRGGICFLISDTFFSTLLVYFHPTHYVDTDFCHTQYSEYSRMRPVKCNLAKINIAK